MDMSENICFTSSRSRSVIPNFIYLSTHKASQCTSVCAQPGAASDVVNDNRERSVPSGLTLRAPSQSSSETGRAGDSTGRIRSEDEGRRRTDLSTVARGDYVSLPGHPHRTQVRTCSRAATRRHSASEQSKQIHAHYTFWTHFSRPYILYVTRR